MAGIWVTYREMNKRSTEISRRFQEHFTDMLRHNLEENWPDCSKDLIEKCCIFTSKEHDFRFTVVDYDRKVLGDSFYTNEELPVFDTSDYPEIQEAFTGVISESIRESNMDKVLYRFVAAPIRHEGKVVAVIRTGYPATDIVDNSRNILYGIIASFLLILLVYVILSTFLSLIWSKPLKELAFAARQVKEGKFEPLPVISSTGEISDLVEAMNYSQKVISRHLQSISKHRKRLQKILQSLPDAIFAIDSQDKVAYFNESARVLFDLQEITPPVLLQRLLPYGKILDFYRKEQIEDYRSDIFPERIDLRIGTRNLTLSMELVDISSEDSTEHDELTYLLIIHNMTPLIETYRIRADFVANTSHELRTPLTTIRATLDNLADGLCNDPEEFNLAISILDRHLKRLELLTDDLLTLHRLERDHGGELLETSLAKQAWLEEVFRPKAEEKGVELSIEMESPERAIVLDNKRLGLILQNILDNAIKFTPKDGSIKVRLSYENDRYLTILCRDTGCGIHEDDIPRIFERFYRAKPSNPREQRPPGTGLGLAIVKHAIERMNGNIDLKSAPGKGTAFIIKIPVTMK